MDGQETAAARVAQITPVLYSARMAAAYCAVSRAHWDRLVGTQRAPQPIHLGECRRWRKADLDAWIAGGGESVERAGAR